MGLLWLRLVLSSLARRPQMPSTKISSIMPTANSRGCCDLMNMNQWRQTKYSGIKIVQIMSTTDLYHVFRRLLQISHIVKRSSSTEVCSSWCSGSPTACSIKLCALALVNGGPLRRMLYFTIFWMDIDIVLNPPEFDLPNIVSFFWNVIFVHSLFLICIYFFKKLILWRPYILDIANVVSAHNVYP